MEYPLVVLRIKNNVVSVELLSSEGVSRLMFVLEEKLGDVISNALATIGLPKDIEVYGFSRTGDEEAFRFNPLEIEGESFSAKDVLNQLAPMVEDALLGEDLSPEVADQLREYAQADLLASFIDELYNLFIAQTLYAASDLGLANIALDDDRTDKRLREKMSKELGYLDEVEFSLISL